MPSGHKCDGGRKGGKTRPNAKRNGRRKQAIIKNVFRSQKAFYGNFCVLILEKKAKL